MANLPPRPAFTNLGDGAPAYNSRRQSASQPRGAGAGNPSHARHYHPYDRRLSTTPQSSPIPPWRRDAPRQSRSSDLSSRPAQRRPTAFAQSHHAAAPNATHARHHTLYQGPSVAYSAVPSRHVVPPGTTGPLAGRSPRHNITSPGHIMSNWAAVSSQRSYSSNNSGNSGWITNIAAHNQAGFGNAGGPVPTSQAASPHHGHHRPSRTVSHDDSLGSRAGTGSPFRLPSTPGKIGIAVGPAGNAMSPSTTKSLTSPSSQSTGTSPPSFVGTPTKTRAPNPVDGTTSETTSPTSAVPCASPPETEDPKACLGSPSAYGAAAGSGEDAVEPSAVVTDKTTSPPTTPAALAAVTPRPASRADIVGPSDPLGPFPSAGRADHAGPDLIVPWPISPPMVFHPAPQFSMNGRTLVFNLSVAADQSDETATLSPGSGEEDLVIGAGSSSNDVGGDGEFSPVFSPLPRSAAIPSITTSTITNPITLCFDADTRLVLTLGPSTRAFLTTRAVLTSFTAWNHHDRGHSDPNSAAVLYDTSAQALTVDLGRLIQPECSPACPFPVAEQHLGALHALLAVMHHHNDNNNANAVLNVDELWRLGGLKNALGLEKRWVEFLRECMRAFAGAIKRVGGWLNFGGSEELGEEEADLIGGSETMERAVNTCLVFGWGEELRVVTARLAYVCAVAEDEATREVVLLKPGGRRLEVGICGTEVVDAILAARGQILENLSAAAQKSVRSWITRIGRHPCDNMMCNTNRLEALITVLRWLGLFPRANVDTPLHELVTVLQFTTASDAELMAAAIENDWDDDSMRKRFNWPMYIRQRFGGTCTKCDEKSPTSMLFPLEDLLCDLTFEMQDQLQKYIELRWP
ncbi:hypothetical protein N657DRAFT_689000 [Parathielavia appendiculata]|uniref:Uncharacterized protein n=1 Tax=Parathielavia appendiculata TaxID=2587402 RepID=A0AAN6U7K1_9PEZI|nr:hypothetical protein N657DRAFT_689000 [Parathielavia appendiculata]